MCSQIKSSAYFTMCMYSALAETEHRYHASDCTECQQVIQGYENVAKHMQRESTILENQVRNIMMMMMLDISITHIYTRLMQPQMAFWRT